MKKKTKWIWLVLIIILVIVGFFWIKNNNNKSQIMSSKIPDELNIKLDYTVKKQTIGNYVELSGTVDAEIRKINTAISGEVDDIYVRKGQKVSVNQNLMKLDDLEAKIEYTNQKIDYENSTDLGEKQREIKKLQLDKAENNLGKTEINSPVNGVVNEIKVNKKDPVSKGSELISIVDQDSLLIKANIDEIDLNKIKLGTKVNIFLEQLRLNLGGTITFISSLAENQMGVVTIPVEVSFDKNPAELGVIPGLSVKLNIVIEEAKNVVAVPSNALKYDTLPENSSKMIANTRELPENMNFNTEDLNFGKPYVEIEKDGVIEKKYVKIGLKTKNFIEIVEGLNEGEKIKIIPSSSEINRIDTRYSQQGAMMMY